jgi:arylsulfatase
VEVLMTSKNKRNHYLLMPVLLALMGLAIYLVFQLPGIEGPQPNVLFITMDSLRHDHLGYTGYQKAHTPHIDALAQDGAVFMEAIAQGTLTRISVPSIVTGRFSYFTRVRRFSAELDSAHTTLAEVLSADEYSAMTTTRMWSESFYQGFDTDGIYTLNTTKCTQLTIEAFDKYQDGKFFIWLYYWDPHAPYAPPEEFMRLFEPDYQETSLEDRQAKDKETGDRLRDNTGHYNGSIATLIQTNTEKITLDALDRAHLINLYDAEIAYVDHEIGKVVAELKKLGLYDNTLIVLNSDHGEGFGEHKKYYHGGTVYDEMARVPLIIKPPHGRNENKVVWGQVRNLDIMPTILDYCHLEVPEECDGHSLRPFIEGDASPSLPSITETYMGNRRHLMAFRHGGQKLIYDMSDDLAWLYDLGSDPGERNSLLSPTAGIEPAPEEAEDPARQKEQQMRRELMDLLNLKQLTDLKLRGKDLQEIDEKTRERLKALGYVY